MYQKVFQYGRYMATLGNGWYEDWTHYHEMHNELFKLLHDAQRPLEEVLHNVEADEEEDEESDEEESDDDKE